ncbi:MAG: twin-arginine translocase subunit TatC [Megasphaera massiliensis]|jgi:sec-independent protein translocase protein TatC|uniref:twin-arginine translocase subunit TatC n=1 Tax=Megasphaera massiliensis TaxID=1232428 RepID=UPI002A7546F9|nr:twin-arginine translocase subunit TatC [Megasphaera massiliensis]MDY2964976.1 twin-arginine translocase subunit TatC [Megasphaera massiliensis]
MTVTDHLTELRGRIIKSVIAVAVGVAFCAWQIDAVVAFLTSPVERLYVMKPAEAFMIYMKIALWSGVVAAAPVWFYQFWAFLLPAFTKQEKKGLLLIVLLSTLLFLGGIAFAFFIVLPQGLRFFMSFAMESVQPLWSLAGYLDFAVLMVVPFGIIFNLPVALVVLARMGLVSSIQLKSFRKYVIVISFAIAAVITPTTDMISQSLLAVPMIILYEVSLVFIRYGLKK